MRQLLSSGLLLAGICGVVVACGEELVLPGAPSPSGADAGAGSTEGITGQAGSPDGVARPWHLPLPLAPNFTTFGGAAGEAGEGGRPSAGDDAPVGLAGGGVSASQGGVGGDVSAAGGPSAEGGAGGAHVDGAGGRSGTVEGPAVLFFSEYVEGSGRLKALEIYTPFAASLEGCELQTFFNGKLEPGRLALHGSLPDDGVQVLCSAALASAEPSRCDRSTNLTFNGDDALALVCGKQTLDVIGQIGVDPGTAWGDGATADHTLRRKCAVVQGRQNGLFEPTSEWLSLGPDVVTDLGARHCASSSD